jgi:hypothetical protein
MDIVIPLAMLVLLSIALDTQGLYSWIFNHGDECYWNYDGNCIEHVDYF